MTHISQYFLLTFPDLQFLLQVENKANYPLLNDVRVEHAKRAFGD